MEIRYRTTTEPAVNLAAEEWYLGQKDSYLLLWRNEPAVIIGRNQNAYAQVNLGAAEARGIPVIRRLTGGGAVFHDLGNLNYSVVTDAKGDGIDFARYAGPVIAALRTMGVEAVLSGRNDLLAGGGKISGNAQCVYRTPDGRSRLLHHGTLLLGADLSAMADLLRADPAKFRGKGVDSVRSRVRNLRDLPEYTGPRDAEALGRALADLLARDGGTVGRETEAELAEIRRLASSKYATWDWNVGKTASFAAEHRARFPYGTVEVRLSAEDGILTALSVTGDYFGTRDTRELEAALVGCALRRSDLLGRLHTIPLGEIIAGAAPADVADLLLGLETEEKQ